MKNIKRVIAGLLAVIIILGYVDFSSIFVNAESEIFWDGNYWSANMGDIGDVRWRTPNSNILDMFDYYSYDNEIKCSKVDSYIDKLIEGQFNPDNLELLFEDIVGKYGTPETCPQIIRYCGEILTKTCGFGTTGFLNNRTSDYGNSKYVRMYVSQISDLHAFWIVLYDVELDRFIYIMLHDGDSGVGNTKLTVFYGESSCFLVYDYGWSSGNNSGGGYVKSILTNCGDTLLSILINKVNDPSYNSLYSSVGQSFELLKDSDPGTYLLGFKSTLFIINASGKFKFNDNTLMSCMLDCSDINQKDEYPYYSAYKDSSDLPNVWRAHYGTALMTDWNIEQGSYEVDFGFGGNTATSELFQAVANKSFCNGKEGKSKNSGIPNGAANEIYNVIKDRLDEILSEYKDTLSNDKLLDMLKSDILDVNSYEQLASYVVNMRLVSENDWNWFVDTYYNSMQKTDIYAYKTTNIMDNGQRVVFVTNRMLSNNINISSLINNSALSEFKFVTFRNILDQCSSVFKNELAAAYHFERSIMNKRMRTSFINYDTWYGSGDVISFTIGDNVYSSSSEQAEYVKSVISRVEQTAPTTLLGYITYTYENGLYLLYNGIYGTSDSVNISDPLYVNSPFLNDLSSYSWEEAKDNIWMPLTLPKNINVLSNSVSSFDNSNMDNYEDNTWYKFVKFLYLTSAGFECMNNKRTQVYNLHAVDNQGQITPATYTQTYGYSADDIRDIMEKKSTLVTLTSDDPKDETFSNNSICIYTIKAIIGLHDFMDLVGIDKNDWTESIKEYYELCETYDLTKYKENERFKANISSINTIDEPLGTFMNVSRSDMSEFWKEGYALSSLYVPFETNLYDGSTVTYSELTTDWRVFYYKYGFYRKALLVNTDPSAVINEVISGQKSGYRFATLRDLIYPTDDVVLTVDTNFYNAEKVQEAIDRVDYTSLRGTTLEQTGESEEGNVISNAVSKLQNSIEDSLGLSAESILKHNSVNYYSNDVAINVTHMEEHAEWYDLAAHVYDAYLLSPDEIVAKINEDEYTPTQSFAVVCAIYRSELLWNTVLSVLNSTDKEIFKASKGIINLNDNNFSGSESQFPYTCYLNYLMLEGLEKLMKNSSSGQIDLNAPIFCDIFGNIITESGYVVIPACANATIAGNEWTPYNIGFGTAIGGGEHEIKGCSDFQEWMTGLVLLDPKVYSNEGSWKAEIQPGTTTVSTKYSSHDKCSGYFTKTLNGYMLKPAIITDDFGQSVYMNWGSLNVNGGILKNVLYHKTYKDGSVNKYSDKVINMVIEVLRGAPIDNIDYMKEGIDNSLEISKAGVYLAYKLEDLLNTFYDNKTGNNSMVNYQNLVFVTGFEYIILYIYKLAFAGMILGLFVHLYLDAVKQRIGIRSALEFVFTIACLIFCITLVPDLITYSYYKANRTLLSDDIGYLSTLSYAKELDGSEINVTSLDKPNTTSKIYLKLEDIKFDWIDATLNVLFKNTYETVSDLYEESIEESAIAAQENVVREGDSLYYPIDTLFDDSVLVLNKSENGTGSTFSLQYTGDGDVVSFVCPYYVILQQFVQSVNAYNIYNNIEAMSASISSGENAGHVLTYDLLTQYFNSDIFLAEGYDITGMHYVLEDASPAVLYIEPPFDTIDLDRMEYSMWYPDQLSANERSEKVNRLEEYARLWVSDNKDLFGKLPDEVLIKSFALNMAIKFNQICNVPVGNSYEIIDIDSRDLFRMMIADNDKTYKYFSYGLARFTYECGGAISCIFMMFYIFIDVIIGYIKTIIMVVIIGLLLFNIIFRKLIFTKDSRCIEGYLITCAGIIIFNYMYSLLLALQFKLSEMTSVTALVIIFGILVQCIYVALMIGLVILTIKDWRNNGYGEYSAVGNMIINSLHNMQAAFNNRRLRASNSAYASVTQPKWQQPERGSRNIMEQMRNRDERRGKMASEQDGLYDTTVNGSMYRRQHEQSNYDYEVDDDNPYDRI